jgi:hypothetical protein
MVKETKVVNGKRWFLEDEIPEHIKSRIKGLPKTNFSFYGVDTLDNCPHNNAHYPHGDKNRYCLGRGGIVDCGDLTIVITERPDPRFPRSVHGYWVVGDPPSILNYREKKEEESA